MPNLSKIFIGFLLSIFFVFTHIGSAFAITKGGINVADHLNEIPQAAAKMGEEGWIYTMACPGDAATILESASSHPNMNLMIRGHYPDNPLTPELAKAWVAALGMVPDDKFPNVIYFMPANEPNHPAGTPDATPAPTIVAYIKELRKALDDSGVGTRVKLLSPMLDVFYFWNAVHATPSINYAQELQAAYGQGDFFSQFDGISVNLYADYINGAPNPAAAEIQKGRGYKEFIQTYYGNAAANKPIYAAETGVIKRPSDSIRYRENIPELLHFYGQWVRQNDSNNWQEDDRFKMFSIFSYDPHGNKTPWIYNSDGGVVAKMKEIQKGSGPTRVNGFNRGQFDAWKASAGIDESSFINCGKGGVYQTMNADYYDTKEEGQVYRLKIKEVPVGVNELTVRLSLDGEANVTTIGDQKDSELDHADPLWDKTYTVLKRSIERLKPQKFEPLTEQLPVPTLAQDTFARVCKVEARAIKKLPDRDSGGSSCGMPGEYCSDTIKEACSVGGKPGTKECRHDGSCTQNLRCDLSGAGRDCTECFVEESEDLTNNITINFDIEGKLEQIPGDTYGGSATTGRVLQSFIVHNQGIEENKPYQIVTPAPINPEVAMERAANCSQEDFEFLEYAVDVPTTEKTISIGGNDLNVIDRASSIFRGWIGSIFGDWMFRDVTVVFKWRGYKPLAKKQNEFLTDDATGTVMPFLPLSQQKVEIDHGETNAALRASVAGGYEVTLEPVYPSQSSAHIQGDASIQANAPGPVRIPDPLGERETVLPNRMFCGMLPYKILGIRTCNDGVALPGLLGERPSFGIPGVVPSPVVRPSQPPGGVLACTIDYTNPAIVVADPESVITQLLSYTQWYRGRTREEREQQLRSDWNKITARATSDPNYPWSPAFLLALWIEESGASGVRAWDMGCTAVPQNNLDAQLRCVAGLRSTSPYNQHNPPSYEQFMCYFSEGHYPCNFSGNPHFVNNFTSWFNRLSPGNCVPR